jgi:superfamily II DNA or RNA helicase
VLAIRVGNVRSALVGNIEERVFAYLDNELSFELPDADLIRKAALARHPTTKQEYMERNRMANWDGRRHLLTPKRHDFPTGLLPRVLLVLNAICVPYQVYDERRSLNRVRFNPMRSTAELRPYQRDAVNAAITSQMGTVRVPTGGGKTRIGCAIMAELGRPALFLVTRRDLLYQAIANFRDLLQYGSQVVGQIGDGVFEPNFITVATVQSICAALGEKAEVDEESSKGEDLKGAVVHRAMVENLLANTEIIIMDEVQHIAARTCLSVLDRCAQAKWRIGLSATDWRDDGADLLIEGAVGPRVVNVSMTHLVAWGFLVPPRIQTYIMAEHEDGWDFQGDRNWNSVYKYFYVQNAAFHEQVADIVKRWLAANRTILTLVTSVEHGRTLERIHHEMGLPAVFLSGISSTKKRAEVLNDVRTGTLRHLIATSIADEGLDLPSLDALVLAGGGKSSTRALQRIGRVLRPAPGKTEGLVAEFHCPDHEWLTEQYRRRRQIYEAEKAFILE